jgi:DeoR family glycerol-3-phosphate regulon repressor
VRIGHLSQVHTFITDQCPSEGIRGICQEHDVRLVETSASA